MTILIGFVLFPAIHSHWKPIGSQPCLGDWAAILDFITDLGARMSFNYLGLIFLYEIRVVLGDMHDLVTLN